MRKLLWLFIRVVCTAGFISACVPPQTHPEPVATTIVAQPSAQYSVWWSEVQHCAGAKAFIPMESVLVHIVEVDAPTIKYGGKELAAFFTGDELWIAKPFMNDRAAVAHEMMHAALFKIRGHPVGHENQYFGPGNACRLTVTYAMH